MAAAGHMEQLSDPIYKLDAFVVNSDGVRAPFSLAIFSGGIEKLGHSCWVQCPHIRSRNLKIIGGDDEEALENAILFAKSFLKFGGEYLVNDQGELVHLPPYDYEVTEE